MPSAKGSRRRSPQPSRNRRPSGNKKSSTPTILIIVGCVAVLGLLGFGIYKLLGSPEDNFNAANLDKYVEASSPTPLQLNDGEAVYLDFSNGMNSAFASGQSKEILKALVNKLSGKTTDATFYSLANNKITELASESDTQLYNRIMAPSSYANQSAPIQAALEKIVSDKVPALLITDYEEYNGGLIQQAAYAKESFINWLTMGGTIIFYEWDYTEGAKQKKLFVTVFDDSYYRLASKVSDAMAVVDNSFVNQYVLGGRDFAFPEQMPTEGANYRNSKGQDIVTCVPKPKNYNDPKAKASGDPNAFSPLANLYGPMAQYYPMPVDWEEVVVNAKGLADFHLLSKLYVDFDAQSGYDITAIEARAFNVQETVDSISANVQIEPAEIQNFVTGTMTKAADLPGYQEIIVDLAEKFNPQHLPTGMRMADVMRINICISAAKPKIEEARAFFTWEGNNSLAASVINTLQASEVNPTGRVLFSYFIKSNK